MNILERLQKMAKDQTQRLQVIHAELNHMQSDYEDRLKVLNFIVIYIKNLANFYILFGI